MENNITKIAVVIPCYKVTGQILSVLSLIGEEVNKIYVVDDCCPDNSGQLVKSHSKDSRIKVLYNEVNLGVGGATLAGYKAALNDQMDIVVKLDGDGQMDPKLIPTLIQPILNEMADYSKGNRFYSPDYFENMPAVRLIGNGILSFFIKFSSGYWNILDPNNGFIAIHCSALKLLPLNKINKGYFFESDMLFRLNIIRAVVIDVPIKAFYGEEVSNLHAGKMILPFLAGHCRNLLKRITYSYFIRDMNIGSLELLFGIFFLLFGSIYGGINWLASITNQEMAPGGVVMLAGMSIIIGVQLTLSAINYDIQNTPKTPLLHFKDLN